VHFAQTYPQQVLMPRQPMAHQEDEPDNSPVLLPDQPRTQ